MLPFLTAIAGALLGAFYARRQGGKGFDIAQYAAVWSILGGLAGLLAIILLTRL
ncbi:hypothetical protein [Jannaschia formosa]|uniref:hypothetical protein n=1 Tax=Jannaschia formosa TaxID=2259592 RepID=UPI001431ABDB|nr:hypothetical protein [Jannaschia formosa]